MNMDIFELAESFLLAKKIEYVKPGYIGERDGHRIEVIFLIPDALDPNIVVDPPDVRLWVNTHNGDVDLIQQM